MGTGPEKIADLILVGTVHGDPEGYRRAWRLLRRAQPEVITVEISRFSLRYRQKQKPLWDRRFRQALSSLRPEARQHLALRRIAAQLAWPFEVQAAQEYARQQGIRWQPIDIGRLARSHLPRYSHELLSPDNFQHLLLTEYGDWEQYIEGEYRRAHRALSCPDCFAGLVPPHWMSPENAVRERVLARRLRALSRNASRLVHLGGWTHLLTSTGWPTLAQLLNDLHPRCFLLSQVDGMSTV